MSRFAAKTYGYESEAEMLPSPTMSMGSSSPEGKSFQVAVDKNNFSAAFSGDAANSISSPDTSRSSSLEGEASGLSSRTSSLWKRNSAAVADTMENQEQVKSSKPSPDLVYATRTRASPRMNTSHLSTPRSLTKQKKTPSKNKLSPEKPVLKDEIKKEETKVKEEPVVDTVSVPTAERWATAPGLFFQCVACIQEQRLKGMGSKRKMPEGGFPNPNADPSRCIECGSRIFNPRQNARAFYMNPHKETRVCKLSLASAVSLY